ncbi:MAG TPA: hypothetical protein C5S51_02450 [Methanosarcinaceae archaeon]|nr:hypothetical protein [Methanosarcinaceae archaeon]
MVLKKEIVLILLTALFIQSIIPAFAEDDVVWEDEVIFTFSWSSSKFPNGDYVISLTDFNGEGLVSFNILKNDVIVDRVILSKGAIWNYNDEVKLQAVDITNTNVFSSFGFWPSNPKAEVKMWRGEPTKKDEALLSLSIGTESPYELDSDIIVNITLENDGDFTAKNVAFDIDIDDLTLKNDDDKLSYSHIGSIEGDENKIEEIKLRFPAYPKKNSYPFNVNASWSDSNGTVYTVQRSATIKIEDPIEIYKNIVDEIGIGKNVYVSVRVSNVQTRKVHVVLNDTISYNFKFIEGNQNLSWEFDLPAGEQKVFEYTLLPEIPGKLKMPAASASWNLWGEDISIVSNTPDIDVHGPYIYVTKTLNSETDTILNVQKKDLVDVNVEMENIGDLPINVIITDSLPKSAMLIGDEEVLTHNEFIRPGESFQFNYTMQIMWDTISETQLPEPKIQLSMSVLIEDDFRGYENAYTIAQMPALSTKYIVQADDGFVPSTKKDDIKVTDSVEDEKIQNVTGSKELDHIKDVIMPGFEGVFAIIVIVMVFFLRKEHEE